MASKQLLKVIVAGQTLHAGLRHQRCIAAAPCRLPSVASNIFSNDALQCSFEELVAAVSKAFAATMSRLLAKGCAAADAAATPCAMLLAAGATACMPVDDAIALRRCV